MIEFLRFSAVIAMSLGQVDSAPVPTLDEVRRGSREINRTVLSYSVEVEVKRTSLNPFAKKWVDYKASIVFQSDRAGRMRCESVLETTQDEKTNVKKSIWVFDGEIKRELSGQNNLNQGRIIKDSGQSHVLGVAPRKYLAFEKDRLEKTFDEYKCQVIGWETIAGRKVVLIQSPVWKNDATEHTMRLYLDPERHFTLVKSAYCSRGPAAKEWLEYDRVQVLEWAKDASGIWLPTRAEEEHFDQQSETPKRTSHTEIVLKKWVVNPDLPDSTFTLTFEPGTMVNDTIAQTAYRVKTPPPPEAEIRKAAFDRKGSPLERFAIAKSEARLSRQHVLVIFASSQNAAADRLLALMKDRSQIDNAMDEFRILWIATDGDRQPAAQALAKEMRYDLQADVGPVLVVADETGKIVAAAEASGLQKDEALDASLLSRFLLGKASQKLDAEKLLADALALAKKDNKRVIVQETATWCPPCWQLSRFLDAHRVVWEKDYIWIKLDHRWTNARGVANRLRNRAEGGIPWTAILDADGLVLATSNDAQGKNIGFPSSDEPAGIAHFASMLRTTAQRLTAADIARLTDALKANPTTEK